MQQEMVMVEAVRKRRMNALYIFPTICQTEDGWLVLLIIILFICSALHHIKYALSALYCMFLLIIRSLHSHHLLMETLHGADCAPHHMLCQIHLQHTHTNITATLSRMLCQMHHNICTQILQNLKILEDSMH